MDKVVAWAKAHKVEAAVIVLVVLVALGEASKAGGL